MKISHNWLQTYFKEKIPAADKLAELFTFHSFEVEGIEGVKNVAGKIIDTVIDVKILPDRAHYALSHKGIAEEVALLVKLPVKSRFASEIKPESNEKPSIKVENTKFCRRYIGRVAELSGANVTSKDGREAYRRIKEALETIGQRSINPIVDVTNYVMYDIGQPLHAFDADKVKGSIIIRAAKEEEKIVLLDGREITLTKEDHVIADEDGPLVIAGAKGGKRAEISETTRRIIIESANFDPAAVRKTSTKYDIRSDSSKRFENEITAELAIHGMNNICALLKEIMPDAKFGPIADEYHVRAKQTIIEFDSNCLEERLGVKIPPVEARKILKDMRVEVKDRKAGKWSLAIPYERLDLMIIEDIVEEVGRIYGYEHIKGVLPPPFGRPVTILPLFYLTQKIRNILVNAGFSEVSLYTLVESGHIETLKPLAKDKAFARHELAKGMMECLERNALNADLLGLDVVKVFEIGNVFTYNTEEVHLAIGVAQVKKVKGVKSRSLVEEALNLARSDLKGAFSETECLYTDSKPPLNGTVAEINLTALVDSLKLSDESSYKDLNFGKASENRYKKFSSYPFITRDIAVLVSESIEEKDVWHAIKKGIENADSFELLVRHSLFDVFKKEGKTSYAFRMVFQAMDRTLTDDEVNKIMKNIYDKVNEKGWVVR